MEENKCLDCTLWMPHVDELSPEECSELVKLGDLKIEKDNCGLWLCNDGACPHYSSPVVRDIELQDKK